MTLATILFAAAAATSEAAPVEPAPNAVEGIEVVTRAPLVGDLQKGTTAYRPEFFTPVRPANALDMINWLPGFVFEDTRDLRGLDGASGNVLIDGKPPTSKTDTLQNVLRRIPPNQVERVDIIVGGAPGIDMRGRAVIANVILKASAAPKKAMTLSSYTDSRGRTAPTVLATLSRKYEGRTLDLSLEAGRNRGWGPGIGYGPWVRRDAGDAVLIDAETRLVITGRYGVFTGGYEFPLGGGALKVSATARYYLTGFDEVDRLRTDPGRYSYTLHNLYKQGELGARYEKRFGKASLETQLLERLTDHSFNDSTQRPPTPFTFAQDDAETETVLRNVLRYKKSDQLTLEASAEGAYNTVDTSSARVVGGVPQVLPIANVRVEEKRGDAGVKLTWKPNDRYSLDAAMKVEGSRLTATGDADLVRPFTYWKPRVVLAWSPDKSTQLRLRAEHEVGQVAFVNFVTYTEFYSGQFRVGNPNLRPQRAYVAEAVLERRFWSTGNLSLTLRRQALRDVVDVAPVISSTGVYGIITNIGDGRETDVVVNLTVPLKRIGLNDTLIRGVLNRNRRRVTDPLDGRLRPLSQQAGVTAELHLAQDLPRWKLNWGFDAFYRGAYVLYRPLGNEASDAWPRLNLFVEYRPTASLNLRAEVQNIELKRPALTAEVYGGLRDRSALLYRDERRFSVGPVLFLRVRKTFE
jgi:hypothetical protein